MQITRSSIATATGPADWFTGDVYVDAITNPTSPSRHQAASVHLTPGARTAWHTHPVEQTIYVLMYASTPEDEMQIQRLLSANCFGDHHTRTGIDIETRELLTFTMLISLGGCEPQAKGHVAANLNVGNDRRVLLSVVTQLLPFIGYPAPSTHSGRSTRLSRPKATPDQKG
jgi:alkylhydroperoxidase/carboxymuconolactone decarboxylase family protein YurZ